MNADDQALPSDPERSKPSGHPAEGDAVISAGEVLSGRGTAPAGSQPSDDADVDDTRAHRGDEPTGYDADSLTEDAIDYLTMDGEASSPVADSDAPAPPG
jgi:hypothetical protein